MKDHINKSPEWKMSKAKAELLFRHPFFACIVMKMEILEKSKEWFRAKGAPCYTMCTDGLNIYWYKEFVEGLSVPRLMGILCHEVLHITNLHHLRRQRRNVLGWNAACDYAINPILTDNGFDMTDCLLDKKYKNMTAEKIYNKFPKDKNFKNLIDQIGQGYVIDFGSGDKPKQGQPKSPEESATQIKLDIKNAAKAAKQAGNLPAGMERHIEDLLEPKINWREVLSRFIVDRSRNDYSWTRPNRRFCHLGLYLPDLYSHELKPPIMMMDTSGSIGVEEMTMAASEAHAILSMFRSSLTVFYIDCDFHGKQEFESADEIKLMVPKGGGGTSFVPGFQKLKKDEYDVSCVIYVTDGYCNSFPSEKDIPDVPVLWLLTDRNKEFKPPFGETAYLE